MSILDEIEVLCQNGSLISVQPSYPNRKGAGALEPRFLYVTPQINEFLLSNHALAPEASAEFTDFIYGERFDVSLYSDHEFYCRLSRLDEAHEGVWESRIWNAEPQLRFYGHFAERNVFIVLHGPVEKRRRFFKKTINHEPIKRTCINAWKGMFTYDPLIKGDDIDAYISNVDLA
jgi:hypothetical protein